MKSLIFYLVFFVILLMGVSCQQSNQQAQKIQLAKPSAVQYKWHEQERIMFLHFAPNTWSGEHQNQHSIPLSRINLEKLNTDQWCEAAIAFGAKQIIHVAKHTGGFCWWQTETTDYGIRNTPYKNGEGDVLKQLSESCKKYGLNLGVYVYPGDRTWGAMIGSGGITNDPAKQEAYNKVFRTQLTEVLTKYGEMTEVWFDGSLKIDVADILEKHAKNAVIFQGPHATVRWPGTEKGKLFYPAWNSLKRADLETGVSVQTDGNPDGDAWAPLEADTPLYDHYWFWSPDNVNKRKSLQELMDCYYHSVGYGAVLLLNASPDTTGLIPEEDMKRYKEFGDEIKRRFDSPIAEIKAKQGNKVILKFDQPTLINHTVLMEDYREGERIREYKIEGYSKGKWVELIKGISVGRKKIDYFEDIEVERIKLTVMKAAAEPLIRSLSAYYVSDFIPPVKKDTRVHAKPKIVSSWKESEVKNQGIELKVQLNDDIRYPGQYELSLKPETEQMVDVKNASLFYNGNKAMEEFLSIKGNTIRINQTAAMSSDDDLYVILDFELSESCEGNIEFRPLYIY